jgi:hypothetical protein
MSRVTKVEMQFGTASLDTSGISPLLSTVTGSEDTVAVVLTPNSNLETSAYVVEYPLYTVNATAPEAANFNYLIVSST